MPVVNFNYAEIATELKLNRAVIGTSLNKYFKTISKIYQEVKKHINNNNNKK